MNKAQAMYATVKAMTRRDGGELFTVSWDAIGGRASDASVWVDALSLAREALFNRYGGNVEIRNAKGELIAAGEAIKSLTY